MVFILQCQIDCFFFILRKVGIYSLLNLTNKLRIFETNEAKKNKRQQQGFIHETNISITNDLFLSVSQYVEVNIRGP